MSMRLVGATRHPMTNAGHATEPFQQRSVGDWLKAKDAPRFCFQVGRLTDEGVDALIHYRQWASRPEHDDPLVRRQVWILEALVQPTLPLGALAEQLFLMQCAVA